MTMVGLLGTLHTDELRARFDFSFQLLEELILKFEPDIICGEVRIDDWKNFISDKDYNGYLGPSEYRQCIIPLCQSKDITFLPIDWFDYSIAQLDHFESCSQAEREEFEKKLLEFYEKIFEKNKECSIPLNGKSVDVLIKKKQEWLSQINPVYQNLTWIARNQMMLINLNKVIKANLNKRILCTIGIEHNYYFYEELSKMKEIKVCYPLNM